MSKIYRTRKLTSEKLHQRFTLYEWMYRSEFVVGIPASEVEWLNEIADKMGITLQELMQMYVLYLATHRGDTMQVLGDMLYHWDNPNKVPLLELEADIERSQAIYIQ